MELYLINLLVFNGMNDFVLNKNNMGGGGGVNFNIFFIIEKFNIKNFK